MMILPWFLWKDDAESIIYLDCCASWRDAARKGEGKGMEFVLEGRDSLSQNCIVLEVVADEVHF